MEYLLFLLMESSQSLQPLSDQRCATHVDFHTDLSVILRESAKLMPHGVELYRSVSVSENIPIV